MSTNYSVTTTDFSEKHYIKEFDKKYKQAWNLTIEAIKRELEFIDELFKTKIAECIIDSDSIKICKTEFRIPSTKFSRHSSGNRCIVAVHKDISHIYILMVYGNNHIKGNHETNWWQAVIKGNYKEYGDLF